MVSFSDTLQGRSTLLGLAADPMTHADTQLSSGVRRRVDPVQVGLGARSISPFLFIYFHRLSLIITTLVGAFVARSSKTILGLARPYL
jgi:hypothetical protein